MFNVHLEGVIISLGVIVGGFHVDPALTSTVSPVKTVTTCCTPINEGTRHVDINTFYTI